MLENLDVGERHTSDDQPPLPHLLVQLLHDLVGTVRLLSSQLADLNNHVQNMKSFLFLTCFLDNSLTRTVFPRDLDQQITN